MLASTSNYNHAHLMELPLSLRMDKEITGT